MIILLFIQISPFKRFLEDIEDNVPIGFPDIIEKERTKGKKVAIYPVGENNWLDMGQLSELERMRERLYGG